MLWDTKLHFTNKHRQSLKLFAFALIVCAPNLFLDYVYRPFGQTFHIPFGQYICFLILCFGVVVIQVTDRFAARMLLSRNHDLFLIFLLGLLFFQVVISAVDFGSVRTFLIWLTMSFSACCAGYIFKISKNDHKPSLIIVLLLPFLLPLILSAPDLLAFLKSTLLDFESNNDIFWSSHRLYTLHSSPNGFGYDACLATIVLAWLALCSQSKFATRILICFLCLAITCLVVSGTRAALFSCVVGIFTLFFLYSNSKRHLIWLAALGISICVSFAYLLLVNLPFSDVLGDYLRVNGDLDNISSGRWSAMLEMIEIIVKSPIFGVGFGSADLDFPVSPSNLFYFSLAVEIGLLGAVSATLILLYPIWLTWCCRHTLTKTHQMDANVIKLCIAWIFTNLAWLLFEFDAFRISANNQNLVFFWSLLLLYARGKHQPRGAC